VTLGNPIEVHGGFGGNYFLHLQGRGYAQQITSKNQALGITGFLDFVHRPVFQKLKNMFRKLDLFPSSGEGMGHTETDQYSETYLVFRISGHGQSTKTQ
jgi:hypothetical protein